MPYVWVYSYYVYTYSPVKESPCCCTPITIRHNATQGLDLEWAGEVTITSGATEALAVSFLGLIEPGDEVIVFDP